MKNIFFALAIFFTLSATAQVKQTVSKSSITFKIKNMGINTSGNFTGLQADIRFDPANLGSSVIDASVDANTIDTDNGMRDTHLKSSDYFDVSRYPRISMKSVSFKHKSGDNYTGVFNVTIKDKTKTVEVPFTYYASGSMGYFEGSFKINRLDFGVGDKSMILSNEATISIQIETSK